MEAITPNNPSLDAILRVTDPLPPPSECPCCESDDIKIKHHDEIYGKAYGKWPWAYACEECDAKVGMHPFTAIPLGILADKNTQTARKESKEIFVSLYEKDLVTRSQAYELLAQKMGLVAAECHFAMFDVAQCDAAKRAVREIWFTIKTKKNNTNPRL